MLSDQELALIGRLQVAERLGIPLTSRWGAILIPEGDEPSRPAILSVEPEGPRRLDLTFPDCPSHRVELLGLVVEQLPDNRIRPYIAIGIGVALEVWLATARLANGLAAAEVAWAATGAESRILLQHGRWRAEDVSSIATTVKWLETIPRYGGRQAASDDEAREEAIRLGLEWLHDNPGALPADFGRKEFSAKRCTGAEATKKWMREKHFGIKDVQRELQRRFQRPA